nr:5-oxoprolinase subunit PxpB [Lysobacter chinensis]
MEPLADDAWLVAFGESIDEATLERVHALAARLDRDRLPGVVDLVPAYASLGVFFDSAAVDADAVARWLRDHLHGGGPAPPPSGRVVDVPVSYGGRFGPDLADAAHELGLDSQTLAHRHASSLYTVAMIGFAPGFPYLSGLPSTLALPRLATPRTRIPAGSVAIGGRQTGIYPRESPGGWRIIGRTPLVLFDPCRERPALLAPGDRVRFRMIDADTFERLASRQGGGGG